MLIDLSHLINSDISVYPGTEKPIFRKVGIVEEHGYNELIMTMYTHTATHIDAPSHILAGTPSLDDFPIDKFMGRAIVIDVREFAAKKIPLEFIQKQEALIAEVDFVLLKSGWSEKWKTDEYFSDFPVLQTAAAQWLTGFRLKGIGLDCISLDEVGDNELPNHKIVLKHDFIIIENLTNLEALPATEFLFQCLPLKIEHADGSPVRAVAMVD